MAKLIFCGLLVSTSWAFVLSDAFSEQPSIFRTLKIKPSPMISRSNSFFDFDKFHDNILNSGLLLPSPLQSMPSKGITKMSVKTSFSNPGGSQLFFDTDGTNDKSNFSNQIGFLPYQAKNSSNGIQNLNKLFSKSASTNNGLSDDMKKAVIQFVEEYLNKRGEVSEIENNTGLSEKNTGINSNPTGLKTVTDTNNTLPGQFENTQSNQNNGSNKSNNIRRTASSNFSDTNTNNANSSSTKSTSSYSNDGGNVNAISKDFIDQSDLSEDEVIQIRHEALKLTNQCREKYGLKPLVMSDELNEFAQEWANELKENNGFGHNPRSMGLYGENIYTQSWKNNLAKNATDSFFEEVGKLKNEPYNENSLSQQEVGHFTQHLWNGSTEFGAGVIKNGRGYVLVCNYNPPGNVKNNYRKNVPNVNPADIAQAAISLNHKINLVNNGIPY